MDLSSYENENKVSNIKLWAHLLSNELGSLSPPLCYMQWCGITEKENKAIVGAYRAIYSALWKTRPTI